MAKSTTLEIIKALTHFEVVENLISRNIEHNWMAKPIRNNKPKNNMVISTNIVKLTVFMSHIYTLFKTVVYHTYMCYFHSIPEGIMKLRTANTKAIW